MTFEPKQQFHVATWGDDSSPGTVGLPFASLGRAQQSVRSVTAGMDRDVVVNLHAGTHVLGEPLVLSGVAGDSGRNGFRVIYQACGWDVSGGGIEVGNRHPDTDLDRINRDNVIENNVVCDIGVEYKGSVGIYAEKTQGARIAHNQVNEVPYAGISFGEYWTHYPDGATTARGNRILNNHVFEAMKALRDGAGIFTASHQGTSYEDGAVVSGNVVHDIVSSPSPAPGQPGSLQPADVGEDDTIGLYADDDANFITWRENVVYGIGGTAISGCPLHNTFTHNFLEDTLAPSFWCTRGGIHVVFEDNTVLRGDDNPAEQAAAIPACANIVANAGLQSPYRHLADTLQT